MKKTRTSLGARKRNRSRVAELPVKRTGAVKGSDGGGFRGGVFVAAGDINGDRVLGITAK
jgi:hypothetical protein